MTQITTEQFQTWANYIYLLCGMRLVPEKAYLLQTRFSPLMRQLGCSDLDQLYHKVVSDQTGSLRMAVIEAITTKETYWFRDGTPFDILQRSILPELIKARSGKGTIRIWSAACSTGQEVYSIAMIAKEAMLCHAGIDITILGTDISDQAIATASYGRYTDFEIGRGLPQERLDRYFYRDGTAWRVRDELRVLVHFRRLNLMQPFAGLGRFDVVFCRNVAIYFSQEDRKRLFERIAEILQPPGYLIIGASEYLTGICNQFQAHRCQTGVYYRLATAPSRQQTPPAQAAVGLAAIR